MCVHNTIYNNYTDVFLYIIAIWPVLMFNQREINVMRESSVNWHNVT